MRKVTLAIASSHAKKHQDCSKVSLIRIKILMLKSSFATVLNVYTNIEKDKENICYISRYFTLRFWFPHLMDNIAVNFLVNCT